MRKKLPLESAEALAQNLDREEVRARLRQAGVLVHDLGVKAVEPISDEELERTGDLRPGALPSEALIRQDRG